MSISAMILKRLMSEACADFGLRITS